MRSRRSMIAALAAIGAASFTAATANAADTVTFKDGTPPASESGCTFGKGVTTCTTSESVTTVTQLGGGCSK